MRVLFLLEPVIFRGEPAAVAAHFPWAECFQRAALESAGAFALAANPATCAAWRARTPSEGGALECFEIDPFEVLAAVDHERRRYARMALEGTRSPNALTAALERARDAFRPDVVVMTSQNAIARNVFPDSTILSIEQAPLPRAGQPLRVAIDPCGHLVGSVLERAVDRIKALPLEPGLRDGARTLLHAMRRVVRSGGGNAAALAASEALRRIQREGPVALLVSQPPDAVTYEGAYHEVEFETLFYAWAEALPPGWIGVPTYHAGWRLSPQLEDALARSTGRLRFLPAEHSQSLTEPLLALADGVVTISSSCAMTALLMGRKVVTVGRSPFSAWCGCDIGRLHQAIPLSEDEAVSTFVFLTHRYSHDLATLMRRPAQLVQVVAAIAGAADPVAWLLDTDGYDLCTAALLFNLDAGDADVVAGPVQRLRADLDAFTAQYESLKAEWQSAVLQRDRAESALELLRLEHDSVRVQWQLAVQERDELRTRDDTSRRQLERLRREAEECDNECARLARQLATTTVRSDALAGDCTTALNEMTRLSRALGESSSTAGEAARRFAELEAAHAALGTQLSVARSDRAASAAECEAMAQERALETARGDALTVQLRDLEALRQAALREAAAAQAAGEAQARLLQASLDEARANTLAARAETLAARNAARAAGQAAQALRERCEASVEKRRRTLHRHDGLRRELKRLEAAADAERQLQDAARARQRGAERDLVQQRLDADGLRSQWMASIVHVGKVCRYLAETMAERDSALLGRAWAYDRIAELSKREQQALFEARELRASLQALHAESARSAEAAAEARRRMEQSLSWRLSRPLRRLGLDTGRLR